MEVKEINIMDENVNKKIDTSPVSTVEWLKMMLLISIIGIVLGIVLQTVFELIFNHIVLIKIEAVVLGESDRILEILSTVEIFLRQFVVIFYLAPPLFIFGFSSKLKQNIQKCCKGSLIVLLNFVILRLYIDLLLLF